MDRDHPHGCVLHTLKRMLAAFDRALEFAQGADNDELLEWIGRRRSTSLTSEQLGGMLYTCRAGVIRARFEHLDRKSAPRPRGADTLLRLRPRRELHDDTDYTPAAIQARVQRRARARKRFVWCIRVTELTIPLFVAARQWEYGASVRGSLVGAVVLLGLFVLDWFFIRWVQRGLDRQDSADRAALAEVTTAAD
jgi:hypothetical protein